MKMCYFETLFLLLFLLGVFFFACKLKNSAASTPKNTQNTLCHPPTNTIEHNNYFCYYYLLFVLLFPVNLIYFGGIHILTGAIEMYF